MSLSRLNWLEEQLERDDLTDLQFDSYNKEANAIQTEINQRRAERKAFIESQQREKEEELAMEKIAALTEEMVDKMYHDTCIKYQDVNGMSFKKWYEQSQKYYTIDSNFVVHSRARSPKTVESVPCVSLAHAKYRILVLIRTKFNDHAHRGYDFAWDIE